MSHDPLDMQAALLAKRRAYRRDLLRLLAIETTSLLGFGFVLYAYVFGVWTVPVHLRDFQYPGLTALALYVSLNGAVIIAHVAQLFSRTDVIDTTLTAQPDTDAPCLTALDHVYRRDGDTVVCTRCAERLTLAPLDPDPTPPTSESEVSHAPTDPRTTPR